MRIKDPTAWIDDFNVFLDDEEVTETAALHEPNLVYSGSKVVGAVWLTLVGTAAGALAALTLSPAVRGSVTSFALYLAAALVFFAALRPATERLAGRALVFPARTTVFWAAFLAIVTVLSAGVETTWLSYGLSVLGGFFVGMMYGSLSPNTIKNEDAWMGAALPAGIAAALLATSMHRNVLQDPTGGVGGARRRGCGPRVLRADVGAFGPPLGRGPRVPVDGDAVPAQ